MPLPTEPSLRLILLGISLLCVLWGVMRGIGRLIRFTLALAAGAAAAWAFHHYAPGAFVSWLNGYHAGAVGWGAVVCGVAGFWFALRFLGHLFHGSPVVPHGAGPRTRAGLISLFPALLLVWGGIMAVRWYGSVARMQWVEETIARPAGAPISSQPPAARLLKVVSTGITGDLADRVDPFHSRTAGSLGAILTVLRNDAAWVRLLRQPRLAPLLQTGVLRRLVRDDEVLHALSFSHYSKLMTLPEMQAAARNPAVRTALQPLALEPVLAAALSESAPLPEIPRALPVP